MTDTSIDDLWINACQAFPDTEPLVKLLRSDTPMTSGARDLLANLLSPSTPPSDSFMLVAKPNPKWFRMMGTGVDEHGDDDQGEFGVVATYAEKVQAGLSSEAAEEAAGLQKNVGPKQVHRYRIKLRELGRYLRGT